MGALAAVPGSLRPRTRVFVGALLTLGFVGLASGIAQSLVYRAAAAIIPVRASYSTVSGTYVGGSADAGSLYIGADGSSRFLAPDGNVCPSCTTAASPVASIDLKLKSISLTGRDVYHAAGLITATSDVPWAAGFRGRPRPGSSMSLKIGSSRDLTLSFLAANDVLTFTSRAALYSNTPPCTVAAVTAPIRASESHTTVAGVVCASDRQWAEASAVYHAVSSEDEDIVLEADYSHWVVIDRSKACDHHDVPASFFRAACGAD
jgi:hypothetical protein